MIDCQVRFEDATFIFPLTQTMPNFIAGIEDFPQLPNVKSPQASVDPILIISLLPARPILQLNEELLLTCFIFIRLKYHFVSPTEGD